MKEKLTDRLAEMADWNAGNEMMAGEADDIRMARERILKLEEAMRLLLADVESAVDFGVPYVEVVFRDSVMAARAALAER
jgi:hypothetical protein